MYSDGSDPRDASMILVMGVTGSGKSHLINQLAGKTVVDESSSLYSCTATCTGVPIEIGRSKVILIDTPGFDDTEKTDTEILTEISRLLAAQYRLKVGLKGIIYLHRINDIRFTGSSAKTLRIFKELCGEASLRNVILASTRWDLVEEWEGAQRENQLRTEFWSSMISKGSYMTRFGGDRDSAIALVSQLLGSANVVLDIQRELVDEGKTLDETKAGEIVGGQLSQQIAQAQRDLEDSKAEIDNLRQNMARNDQRQRERAEEERRMYESRLLQVQKEKVRLHTDVATEVREEVDMQMARTKKRSNKLGIIAPILPTALSVLGHFMGIPTGMGSLFTSWIVGDASGGGIFETLSELFDL